MKPETEADRAHAEAGALLLAARSYVLGRKADATDAEFIAIIKKWSVEGWQAVARTMLGRSITAFDARAALDLALEHE